MTSDPRSSPTPAAPASPGSRAAATAGARTESRLAREAGATEAAPGAAPRERRVSRWWRMLAVLLLMVVLIGWAASASMIEQLKAQLRHAQARLVEQPQITQVALLLDRQQQPAMLATYTLKDGKLQLQRLNSVREGREDSMQVWALAGAAPPRSLGVIESKYQTLQLPLAPDALQGVTELAVSAESKGGVPPGSGPSLPWLFKGWLVQKAI